MNQETIPKLPRVVIAGTGSGCGKTTIACGIMKALTDQGTRVAAYKCGPDYIDPMFHQAITGCSANLDSFLFHEGTLRYLLAKHGAGKDIGIVEGVMGYYDGILENGLSQRGSTYDIARITKTPVILAVNAKGAAASVLAVIHGFLTYYPESGIRGVIFNQCSPSSYSLLEQEVKKRFGDQVKVLGYLPVMKECALESRHLGLVTAAEDAELKRKLERLGDACAKSILLEDLKQLAAQAQELETSNLTKKSSVSSHVRIAVARDKAFCFYYEDSLSLLEEMGASLVPFSPLEDARLPEHIQGIYLGGGYPELYCRELSENTGMRRAIRSALEAGIPCIAECGGFMYLTKEIAGYPMVGYLPGTCTDTGRLSRFGYVTLTAQKDNLLCKKGQSIPAHEFHYWDAEDAGNSFAAVKPSGREWPCVYANEHLYAGFPHFHFYSNPEFAANFLRACRNGELL